MASISASPPGSSKPARASALAPSSASAGTRKDAVPSFGVMWTIMRSIGDMSLPFFFSSVHVTSANVVPSSSTPLILCSNHSNTILDVAVLASHFPERRPLHFWAKAGFFKNPITRFILTSSGNIKVDRRNKNNQALFSGTFAAMKNGGAIALFPEGGSYTIPQLAPLKMGAAWAALEYSRYLQLQSEVESAEKGQGGVAKARGPRTEVKILPAAVVFDDKSKFRSRAELRFGRPISLDAYIDEFLSSPPPSDVSTKDKLKLEDGTMPATPESMTRSNTNTGEGEEKFASPAHRAVARLTKDLQAAMQELTFNAPDWETYQATRAARELIFELDPRTGAVVKEGMDEYVELSRAIMTLLTLDTDESIHARRALFSYSCLLHLADVSNLTLATVITSSNTPLAAFSRPLRSLLLRLPLYIPLYGLTLIPTYVIPNKLAHHFAGREEESLSSVKTLFSFFLTTILYGGLLFKGMQWAKWSPPGLLVGLAGIWLLHDVGRTNIDTAYGLVKQVTFGHRVWQAGLRSSIASASSSSSKESVPSSSRKEEPSTHKFSGWSRLPTNVNTSSKDSSTKKTHSLFFYGTLVHPKILSRVIGNSGAHLCIQNAVLPGAQLFHVRGEEYPGLIQTSATASSFPSSGVKGTLVTGLTDSDVACLDAFEGDEYTHLSVQVIPDPRAPVESNEARLAKAGSAPLHAILAGLTKERIAELCRTAQGVEEGGVRAEVYGWTAGSERLEMDRVWEFDVFAREKAHNWVGDGGEVEHEHEYQLVDQLHATSTSTLTVTPPNLPSTPVDEGQRSNVGTEQSAGWVEGYVKGLTADEGMQEAILRTVRMLSEKPSIQFYVEKAFPRSERVTRPGLGNKHLLSALYRARGQARSALQALLRSSEQHVQDAKVADAIQLLVNAKQRAMQLAGSTVLSKDDEGRWPFTQDQIAAALASGDGPESRKNV